MARSQVTKAKRTARSKSPAKREKASSFPARSPPPPPYEPTPLPSLEGEAARLWQRILEDPDDLDTRRILADQLLEQGNPLGEYIQLATQTEEMDEDDPRRPVVRERAETLRRRNLVPWTRAIATLPPIARPRQPRARPFALHRGLVEELRVDSRAVDALPLAAAVAPIRRLVVDSSEALGNDAWHLKLAAMPELSRIRSLEFGTEKEETALALLASPHLERLERLVLTAPATPRLAQAIADSKACAELVELRLTSRNLGNAGVGAEGAAAIAKLPLRILELRGNPIGDGLSALVKMTTLRSLGIEGDKLGARGATVIAGAPALAELRELALVDDDLGPKGLLAIASCPVLGKLRALDVTGSNGLNGKVLASMLAGWSLSGLTQLRLSGPLRKDGADAIVSSGALDGLEALGLLGAALQDEGAAALARWKPRQLTDVDLGNSGIGAEGMGALADGPLLANVRSLSLRNNKCGTEGGKALAEAKWLARLSRLSLFYNWMGVLGIRAILEHMPEAEELALSENNYGTEPIRVAARGLLPQLQRLDLGTEADDEALQAWTARDDTRRLRSLTVHHVTLSVRTVELLSCLPELEDLQFSFSTFEAGALDALHERFGGLIGFWPPRDA